jgi:hypothetical protein
VRNRSKLIFFVLFSKSRAQKIEMPASDVAEGIKEVVEFKELPDGRKVKVVKKIRMVKRTVKLNKHVEERKVWRKFGQCRNLPAGLEPGVSYFGDIVELVPTKKSADDEDSQPREVASVAAKVDQRYVEMCFYVRGRVRKRERA